ncbi:MAG: DUF692 domain-containing protein [Gammaproteobacteria bacterium]
MTPPVSHTGKFVGAGLGLRRSILSELASRKTVSPEDNPVDFYEVAPENWIQMGGKSLKRFEAVVESVPLVCHGLSLSLGGLDRFDEFYLQDIKRFLNRYNAVCYSEHLSYCTDKGQLYNLAPIPFTEEAVRYVAARIRFVQDVMERRIAIENVSYYLATGQELSEQEFVLAVLEEADCDLLLDVNNVYVNSVNHGYDPMAFLSAMPVERIAYYHIAGHYNEAEDLIIDTHGANVIEPVWSLLEKTYRLFGVKPTLLERDFNFPPLTELFSEVERIQSVQAQMGELRSAHAEACTRQQAIAWTN